MSRTFHILHSVGVETMVAESAARALKGAHVPRGHKEVFGVVDATIVVGTKYARPAATFCAFIGEPAKLESLP